MAALRLRHADDRAEYTFPTGQLLYASATRGFKSGGFNGRPRNTGDLSAFGPEYVWAYETGFKGKFLDGHLQVAVARLGRPR